MVLKKYKSFPWPLNLWSAVFREQILAEDLPGDWEEALEYVLNGLKSPKRKEILVCFFKDGKTLQEIGNIYGTAVESVRQQAEKALRELRHPTKKIFLYIGMKSAKAALSKGQEAYAINSASSEAIDALNLSVRAWNCLKRAGIETIEQLAQHTECELSGVRNMGAKTLAEIKDCLAARGLSLRTEGDC